MRKSTYRTFTKCDRVEDASARLWMKGSVFDIIIIEQCLLGVNEFELLRIGKHKDLPVLTFKDDQLNIVQWSSVNGTCEHQPKLIPMSVLYVVSECMLFKKNNEWAQVQQPTNNVSRERNQRMSWTPDYHEKFVECVQKLGGAKEATPKKILQFLQRNFKGFEDVDREKIASHLQKYRDSPKKEAQPPMTVANEPDILSQQQQDPAAKNTKGFQSVTLPFETNVPTIGGSTSCGNQSNVWMTQMDASSSEQMQNQLTGGQPFDWESFLNVPDELSSLDTFLDGLAENFNGDVSACEHFNNL